MSICGVGPSFVIDVLMCKIVDWLHDPNESLTLHNFLPWMNQDIISKLLTFLVRPEASFGV